MFDVLWTILLGIIGGIISSVIVSRVFMIQGEYQQQVRFVESIMRKLGIISGYLLSCRVVFECSYDEDIRFENEKKEKGYKNEMEYYAAHKDKRWTSVTDILNKFKSEALKNTNDVKEEILNSNIQDEELSLLLKDTNEHLHKISSAKEFNFLTINQFEREEKEIFGRFDNCKRISNKKLIRLVLKDKLMIALYIFIALLILATYLTFTFGW